jgi:hypothetical protein
MSILSLTKECLPSLLKETAMQLMACASFDIIHDLSNFGEVKRNDAGYH